MALAKIAGAVASAGLAVGGLAYAALYPRSQIFGRVLVAPRRPGEIALTFDDGPNPAATPHLLELLARHGVRATFFAIGAFARREPALLREVSAAGHIVGSHTMSHPWLAWQTDARIRRELAQSRRVIEDVLGQPVREFRAPHGARRPYVLRTARDLGMRTVQWNVIANDWEAVSAETIAVRVERGVQRAWHRGRSANVVLHDGSHTGLGADRSRTVAATALLLARFPAEAFVTIDSWAYGARRLTSRDGAFLGQGC